MSRTNRGEKGSGYEYWSRRIMKDLLPGKWSKKLTHKYERRKAQCEIESEMESLTSSEEQKETDSQ